MRNELTPVANSENGNAEFEYFRIDFRGRLFVNAVRTTCENDAYRVERPYFVKRHFVGFYFAINVALADSSGNKLIILSSEIQNEHFFSVRHLIFSPVYMLILFYLTPKRSSP